MVTFGKNIRLKTIFKLLEVMEGMKEVVLQSNPLTLFNVVKPLHMRVVDKGIKLNIMERNTMTVTNVQQENPLMLQNNTWVEPSPISQHALSGRKGSSFTSPQDTFNNKHPIKNLL
ncbi:uncharacterized protein LOC628147 isoform 5 [Mus musculus]|uniref:uncharacterized protein LOC628147 isoform 5 n=1 Tax=Mus musculus TaxID=10090 RepID=UPI0020351B10|nr:uncharacterized protein LOC628147 isoform 5 [Mus musculus]